MTTTQFTITGELDNDSGVIRTYTLVLPPVGQGGNAVVYRARYDDGTGSDTLNCIVKILKPTVRNMNTYEDDEHIWFAPPSKSIGDSLSEDERENSENILESRKRMMRNESAMMSQLQLEGASMHIDAIVRYKNTLAIAMPYEGGMTLAEEYRDSKKIQSEDDVYRVVRDIRAFSRKIALLHAKGKLHMDISPDNIFRRSDGSIVPLDFGGVCGVHEKGKAYSIKAGFSAPEAINSHYNVKDSFGFEADLYSIGAVMFFLLFGRIYDSFHYGELDSVASLPINESAKKYLRDTVLSELLRCRASDRLSDIHTLIERLDELERLMIGDGISLLQLYSRSSGHYDSFLIESRGRYGNISKKYAVPFEMLFGNDFFDRIGRTKDNILLCGSGGAGKTALSAECWGRLLGAFDRNRSGIVPFYVPLSGYPEASDWRDGDIGASFLLRSICRDCFGAESLTSCDPQILNALYSEFSRQTKTPEYVVFADGLDEVRAGVRGILTDEINRLSRLKNLRIVVTSREKDPRLEDFKCMDANGIRDEKDMIKHLRRHGFTSSECDEIKRNRPLVSMIRLPLFMSLICRLHEAGEGIADIRRTGQLFHRYYGEIERIDRVFIGRSKEDGEKMKFIYQYLLPCIAFYMERNNRHALSERELRKLIRDSFENNFCTYEFIEANFHTAETISLLYDERQSVAGKATSISRVIRMICSECCMMTAREDDHGDNIEYSMIHQTLQTFFAALHLCNVLRTAVHAESAELLLNGLSEPLRPEITMMAGDILYDDTKYSPEKKALGLLQGNFGGNYPTAVKNMLSICHAKSGTLDGADLSRLDLTECDLLGVSCRSANFTGARLTDENLLGVTGNICAWAVSEESGLVALFSGRGEMLAVGTKTPSRMEKRILDSDCDMVMAARYAGHKLMTFGRQFGRLTLCAEIYDSEYKLFKRIPIRAERFLPSRKYPETLAEFSPDGRMLAVFHSPVYDQSPDEIILLDCVEDKQVSIPTDEKIRRIRFGRDCLWLFGEKGKLFRVELKPDAFTVTQDTRFSSAYDVGNLGGKEMFLISDNKEIKLADGNHFISCGLQPSDKKSADYCFGTADEPICLFSLGEDYAEMATFGETSQRRTVYASVKTLLSRDVVLMAAYENPFGQKNKYIGLYDIAHEKWVCRLRDHQGVKNGMLSGKMLVTHREKEAVLCDTQTGQLTEVSLQQSFKQIFVSSDGKTLLLSAVKPDNTLALTFLQGENEKTYEFADSFFGDEKDKQLSLLCVSHDFKKIAVRSSCHSKLKVFLLSGEYYNEIAGLPLIYDNSGDTQGQILDDGSLVMLLKNKVKKGQPRDYLQFISPDGCFPTAGFDVSEKNYRLPGSVLLLMGSGNQFSLVSFRQSGNPQPWKYGSAVVTTFSVKGGEAVKAEDKQILCCCTSDPRFDCVTASSDLLIFKQRYTDVNYFALNITTGEQSRIYIDSLRLSNSDFRDVKGLSEECGEILKKAGCRNLEGV